MDTFTQRLRHGPVCLRTLFALMLLIFLLTPVPARAECPPPGPYNAEVQALLDSCQNWVCDVIYNPANGYLPEDHPYPWTAAYEPETIAKIIGDRLVITGPNVPGPLPTAAMYTRNEPALADPTTWLYLIQAQYRVRSLFPLADGELPGDETMAIIGASDPERSPVFSLRYQDGERVVVTGESDYCGVSDWVLPWDWQTDTTYTYVVHRGQQTYLFVDDQAVLVRGYTELDSDPASDPGLVAFTSGDVEAEYAFVQYCVCQPGLFYKGEEVDQSPVAADLVGSEERIVVMNLQDSPDPFHPPDQLSNVSMEIDVRQTPGEPSDQFVFTTQITVQIESFETQQPVSALVTEVPVYQLGVVTGQVSWNGDDDGSGMPVPNGFYLYRTDVQLVRTKLDDGQRLVFDQVASSWRPITVDRF